MERIPLTVFKREELGKGAVKKLRRNHFIPAILYKGGKKNKNLKVVYNELLKIVHTKAGENVILDLHIKDGNEKGKKSSKDATTVIIKDLQHHLTKGEIIHIDFQEISLTETIEVKIPVQLKGDAKGIKEGGIVEHILWELESECLPTEIPEKISCDVSDLDIGDTILVKDLLVPIAVKALTDPQQPVASVAAPEAEPEEELSPEEEAAEPEVIKQKKPEEEEAAEGPEGKIEGAAGQKQQKQKAAAPEREKEK